MLTANFPVPPMTIGYQALDGYKREVGLDRLDGGLTLGTSSPNLTTENFDRLAQDLERLLGSHYSKLRARHERGKTSSTPPKEVNRILYLIDYAREVARKLDGYDGISELILDANLISEILLYQEVFQRWENHPEWPTLVQTLVSPQGVQHNVMLLAVAGYLVDLGNYVGLVPSTEPGRIPDVWIQTSLVEKVEVEVKSPRDFHGPLQRAMDHDMTVQRIQQLFDDAASTKRGQLDPTASGILAIGAFHLGLGGIEALDRAATEVLGRQWARKPHVIGIVLFEAMYVQTQEGPTRTLQPSLAVRIVNHPNYQGTVIVTDGPQILSATPDTSD